MHAVDAKGKRAGPCCSPARSRPRMANRPHAGRAAHCCFSGLPVGDLLFWQGGGSLGGSLTELLLPDLGADHDVRRPARTRTFHE